MKHHDAYEKKVITTETIFCTIAINLQNFIFVSVVIQLHKISFHCLLEAADFLIHIVHLLRSIGTFSVTI